MKPFTSVRHRTAALSIAALCVAWAGCAPMIEPSGDAANDARADGGASRDTGAVEDATTSVDTGAPDDASSGSDAAADVTSSQPDAEPAEACVPQCTGRVCGDDGCGSVCGTCGGGAMCTSMGTCSLSGMMGGGEWSITAVQGDISARKPNGDEWDVGINMTYRLPDPKVCITIGSGREECSGFINNTIAPAWNYRFPSGVDTAQLTGGMLRVRIADDDTAFDDTICAAATAPVTMAQVTARTFTFRCASGGVEFFLTAR
ncbi:MAG: hypothetical protein U0269_35125 [Polyangiales bacterium]